MNGRSNARDSVYTRIMEINHFSIDIVETK